MKKGRATYTVKKASIRLFLIFLSIVPVVSSGILIEFVNLPFAGVLNLNTLILEIGNNSIQIFSSVVTAIWIVWLVNVLSWSNGIDGQYCGIVGISSIIIAILALRFTNIEPAHMQIAVMAAICAGASFGFTKYTWHPSKIMWGFGALSAGLVLSVLSISIRTKVVASTLVILIPFLDAFVTATRRMIQHKSPLKGDKGHLHHLLLAKGWSTRRIALFYWFTTLALGIVGLISSEKYSLQITLTLAGVIAFAIILLNLESLRRKKVIPEAVKVSPKEA